MELVTSAAPQDAWNYLASALTASGIQITYQQQPTLAGQLVEHREANVLAAIVLLLLCLIPGIVYLFTARKTRVHHVSLQFTAEGAGTRIAVTGTGFALTAAMAALRQLPV